MSIYLSILYALIGLISGSFLTVCIDRIPLRQSIIKGRSRCPVCGHQLSYWDMIPIGSWFWLGGRCRYCHAPLPIRYPLIEALNALLWIGIGIVLHHTLYALLAAVFSSILLVLSILDFRTKEVPLGGLLLLLFIGMVAQWLCLHAMKEAILQAVVIAIPFLLLSCWMPDGIGSGDIILLIVSSFMLETGGIVLAAMLGYLLAVLSLFPKIVTGTVDRKAQIPMIPYLSIAIVFTIGYGTPLIRWYLSLL